MAQMTTLAATEARKEAAAVRRRARAVMRASGMTVDEIALAMRTSASAVRQALVRDERSPSRDDWGIVWED